MTCRELAEFIMQYLDGELPAGQLTEFERHLALCPACVHYLDSYRKTVTATRTIARGDESESGELPEDLVKAIAAARTKL